MQARSWGAGAAGGAGPGTRGAAGGRAGRGAPPRPSSPWPRWRPHSSCSSQAAPRERRRHYLRGHDCHHDRDPGPPARTPADVDAWSGRRSDSEGDLRDGASGPAAERCSFDELQGSIDDGGGAASSYGVALVLTNTGDHTCPPTGLARGLFVRGGDGTQLGTPATLDRSSEHPTVPLAHGDYVEAILTMMQAANYNEAECRPQQSEGFRIYPPGWTAGLFVGAGGTRFRACAATDVQQLSVEAIQRGS